MLSLHHTRAKGHKDERSWLQWLNLGIRWDFTEWEELYRPTLSFGSLLMVFSGLRTRSTLRDLIVLMSRPLLFLLRRTGSVRMAADEKSSSHSLDLLTQSHWVIFAHSKSVHVQREHDFRCFYPMTLLLVNPTGTPSTDEDKQERGTHISIFTA